MPSMNYNQLQDKQDPIVHTWLHKSFHNILNHARQKTCHSHTFLPMTKNVFKKTTHTKLCQANRWTVESIKHMEVVARTFQFNENIGIQAKDHEKKKNIIKTLGWHRLTISVLYQSITKPPMLPPWANPWAFDLFENFFSNSRVC